MINLFVTTLKFISLVFTNYCYCSYQYPFRTLWRAADAMVREIGEWIPSMLIITFMDIGRHLNETGITYEQFIQE